MGKAQLNALLQVLQQQLELGPDGVVVGSWNIRYDKDMSAFLLKSASLVIIAKSGRQLSP